MLTAALCSVFAWRGSLRMRQTGSRAVTALARELDGVESDRQRVAAVNEVLADLDHALRPDLRLPTKLAWIVFVTSLALMIAARLLGEDGALAGALVCGAAGMASCLFAKRTSRVVAGEARTRVDREIASLVGPLYHAEIVLPKRREMRWKRGRK